MPRPSRTPPTPHSRPTARSRTRSASTPPDPDTAHRRPSSASTTAPTGSREPDPEGPMMTVTAPRIDAVFDLDALLDDEEREWQQRARRFAQERILPVIEDDF